MITKLSQGLARAEIFAASALAILITLLILLNVVTRAMNASIYWVDEAAIYAMVWMTFLAASAGIHERSAVSVTVIKDMLSARAHRLLTIAIDVIVLVFVGAILYFLWRWLLPLDLLRAGFDVEAFQGETFNFVYAEPTTTLGIKKVWVWIIMVAFALGASVHAAANLWTTLRGGKL